MAPAFQVLVQQRRYYVYGPEIHGSDPDPVILLPNGKLWHCYGKWWLPNPKDPMGVPQPGHMAWLRKDEQLPQKIFPATPIP